MIEEFDLEIKLDETSSSINDGKDKVEVRGGKTMTCIGGVGFATGLIIGSGIFMTIKPSYDVFSSHNIMMVVFFWIIAGVISLLGGLCYAELGSRMPESGGERTYYKHILNPKMSRTYVVMYIFVLKVLTMSGLSVAVGQYFCSMIDYDNIWVQYFAAFMALTVSCVINCISRKIITQMSLFLTAVKIFALTIIIITGIVFAIKEPNKNAFTTKTEGFDGEKLIKCIVSLLWANEGASLIGTVAGDMVNPSKDLPVVIIVSEIIVIVLYSLAAVSYSFVLGYEGVQNSKNIATSLAKEAFGKMYFFLPLLVCISCTGSVLGTLYSVSSVVVSSVVNNELPRIFGLVTIKSRLPILTNLLFYFMSVIFIFVDFNVLLQFTCVISWAFYFISFCALLKLKIETRQNNTEGIFTINYVVVGLMIIISLFVVIGCFVLQEIGSPVILSTTVIVFSVQYIPTEKFVSQSMQDAHDNLIAFFSRKCKLEVAGMQDIS